MKKSRIIRRFLKRFISLTAIALIVFFALIIVPAAYSGTPRVPTQGIVQKITGSKGNVIRLRVNRDGTLKSDIVQEQMDVKANDDIVEIVQKEITLDFKNWNFTAVIGGDKSPTRYSFPAKISGGNNALQWRAGGEGSFVVINNDKRDIRRIKLTPRKARTHATNFPENLVAQATMDSQPINIPGLNTSGIVRYCSALSDFSVIPTKPTPEYGKAWGIATSKQGWDIFSLNDPCRKALKECESEEQKLRKGQTESQNQKLGTRCDSVDTGVQPIDNSEVVVSFDCSGNSETPFSRFFYSEIVRASEDLDQQIEKIKVKVRNKGGRSCLFDISLPGTEIITPVISDQPNSGQLTQEVIKIRADATGEKVLIQTFKGSVQVQAIDPNQPQLTLVPDKHKYYYPIENGKSIRKVEPLTDPEFDDGLRSSPVNQLPHNGIFFNPKDVPGILTPRGKRIVPWEKLGFYFNFQNEWKAIAERDDLEATLKQIQQKEPPLAFTYVNGALGALEGKDPTLAAIFQDEVNHYLNPKIESHFVAFDFDKLISISAEKRLLTPTDSFENMAKTYIQQLKKTRNSVIKYLADQPIQVGSFKGWEVKTRINLKGSFGAPGRGYKKDPEIGAGKTVFVEGMNGKSVDLIQTSYLINWQDTYFKINFITTDARDASYAAKQYKDILDSFQILGTQSSST